MPEAMHLSTNSVASTCKVVLLVISRCSAPWPEDSTCGEYIANGISSNPPMTGRPHSGRLMRPTLRSMPATRRITAMPINAHTNPSAT